jgi:hypothetical protein
MAEIIDGKAMAGTITERVAREVDELVAQTGRAPGLAVVLVGNDPAKRPVSVALAHSARVPGFSRRQLVPIMLYRAGNRSCVGTESAVRWSPDRLMKPTHILEARRCSGRSGRPAAACLMRGSGAVWSVGEFELPCSRCRMPLRTFVRWRI